MEVGRARTSLGDMGRASRRSRGEAFLRLPGPVVPNRGRMDLGDVGRRGERYIRNAEVADSPLLGSTQPRSLATRVWFGTRESATCRVSPWH